MTPARHQTRPTRRGFTIIEMLIVLGILALLAAIVLPTLAIIQNKGRIARLQADMNTIAQALDEYKSNFGDYPRCADPSAYASGTGSKTDGSGYWLDTATDRGAVLLCRALIGPGPAGANPLLAQDGDDGADGPGFRPRRILAGDKTTTPPVFSGKVFGPFLDVSKFKVQTDTTGVFTRDQDAKILDLFGHPYLYYPAQSGGYHALPAGTTTNNAYVSSLPPANYQAGTTAKPYYNAFDNSLDTTPVSPSYQPRPFLTEPQLQAVLGIGNPTLTTAPFLLWSSGPDGTFGFTRKGTAQQVTDFTTPSPSQIDDVIYNVVLPNNPAKLTP